MSSERPKQTVADYVTIVLSPALIMGLVGSLVFFLLEVFYKAEGEYKGRLQWILFFFVFGAVLVGRISMRGEIAQRAGLYGLALAFLTWVGMGSFVEYPREGGLRELSWLINLFLVGLVWWCAHRLTWDCTNIDEDAEVSGEGVLQAAGLEGNTPEQPDEVETDLTVVEEEETDQPKKRKPSLLIAWWERFQRYRDTKGKKRTLGVWVVYFSLAALPLFGLGQSFIPLVDASRRQFAFWLMTIYVGCGLGLLLTTCFLSLRRYLRQRRLQMPAAMTGAWMVSGAGLIAVLLLLGAFLPRPHAEYSVFDLADSVGSTRRKASHLSVKDGGSGEGSGRPGESRPGGEQASSRNGKGDGPGEKGEGGSGKTQKGEGGGKGEKGERSSNQGNTGEKGSKGESRNQNSGEKQPGNKQPGDKSGKSGQPGEAAKGVKGMNEQDTQASQRPQGAGRRLLESVTSVLQKIGPVLKWIILAILIVVVIIVVARGALSFLAGFTDWAKRLLEAWNRFWANLFGGQRKEETAEAEAGVEEKVEWQQPFADFSNPFDSGAAGRWSARELVRYTFAAVQAWAREHDLGREPGETSQEFAERVIAEFPALEADLRRLVTLYAYAVYGPGGMPANTVDLVRQFWERLERVVVAPLSA